MANQIKLNRQQLAQFLPDHQSIRAFEELFGVANELIDISIDEVALNAIQGDARSIQALDAIEALAKSLNTLATVTPFVEELSQAIKDLKQRLIMPPVVSDYAPPQIETAAFDLGLLQQIQVDTSVYYKNLTSADSPYTASHDQEVLFCDATGGNITVNLAGVKMGRKCWVKKTDASANIVSLASGSNIDGAATFDLLLQYENCTVVSDATTYWVMP